MIKFEEKNTCRFCGTDLNMCVDVLDLGELAPSNFVEQGKKTDVRVPLVLTECFECGLVQLRHTIDREELYRQYWYRSSLNVSMVKALKDLVDYVESFLDFEDLSPYKPTWLDIGANDGTMLGLVSDKFRKVGIDPASNLAHLATEKADVFINDFFSEEAFENSNVSGADVITAIAMFYDLDDINDFMKVIKHRLNPHGVFVTQFTDLTTTLRINAIDNVCHEHLEYYSLLMMNKIAEKYDLEIVDVTYNEVNGGSVRVIMSHKGHISPTKNVELALQIEEDYYKRDSIKGMSLRVEEAKAKVNKFIHKELTKNKCFAVFGASTKGNTLLQYFGINSTHIDHAAEVNEEKFGLKTVATEIPIIDQEESLKQKPDYYLVLPWHFIGNFVETQIDYLIDGGKFLVPLPEPALISVKEIAPNQWEIDYEYL